MCNIWLRSDGRAERKGKGGVQTHRHAAGMNGYRITSMAVAPMIMIFPSSVYSSYHWTEDDCGSLIIQHGGFLFDRDVNLNANSFEN